MAVEPEPILREEAVRAAAGAPMPVDVLDGVAERVPAEDDSFDAGVACLMLCTVDAGAALAELRRVIKPGGELRFYEHVVSESQRVATFQGVADHLWTRMAGGCHLTRDTSRGDRARGLRDRGMPALRLQPDAGARPAAHPRPRAPAGP